MFLIHTRPSRSAAPESTRARSTASFVHHAGVPSGAAVFATVTARGGAAGATVGVDAKGSSSELTIGGFASGAPDSGSGAPACAIADFAPGTDATGARVIAAAMGEVHARQVSLSASRSEAFDVRSEEVTIFLKIVCAFFYCRFVRFRRVREL